MSFIAIIGAGPTGGAIAHKIAARDRIGEVRLIDADRGVAEGKALDILQSAPIEGFSTRLSGESSIRAAAGASAIVLADEARGSGEYSGEQGLTLLRQLGAFEVRAPIVFAGATQLELLNRGASELRIAPRAPDWFCTACARIRSSRVCGARRRFLGSGNLTSSARRPAALGGRRLGRGERLWPAALEPDRGTRYCRPRRADPRAVAAGAVCPCIGGLADRRGNRPRVATAVLVFRGAWTGSGWCHASGARAGRNPSHHRAGAHSPGTNAARQCAGTDPQVTKAHLVMELEDGRERN